MAKLKLLFFIIAFFVYSSIIAQWTAKPSGVNAHLTGVHFPSKNIGFVVSNGGKILKSIDAGETWNTIYSIPNFELRSVYFINEYIGFAVGTKMLKTIDGGSTWNIINLPDQSLIRKIKFITSQVGFFISYAGIFKTIDGGDSWSLKSSANCSSISFPTQNVGYAYSTSLFKTTDGGETWNSLNVSPNIDNTSISSGLFFTTEDIGFFGGNYYSAFTKTLNGGNTWNCITPDCFAGSGNGIESIYFPSKNTGYAVGLGPNDINIQKTSDGGNTWSVQDITLSYLTDVYFTDDNVGFVVGVDGSIFKTENGGSINLSIPPSTINGLKIYPNPTENYLNIDVETNFEPQLNFKLDTILGKNPINNYLYSPSNSIDLSMYPKGVYIYTLLNSDYKIIKTGKIIKD